MGRAERTVMCKDHVRGGRGEYVGGNRASVGENEGHGGRSAG